MVMHPAIIKEFKINRSSGTFTRASRKLLSVGFFGSRFSSMVNNSPDGINAMLSAYNNGSKITKAITKLAARRIPVRVLLFAKAFAFICVLRANSCSLVIVFSLKPSSTIFLVSVISK